MQTLQEKDMFGNDLLKNGDTVIMDNCGFHHARLIEPVLRNMLAVQGVIYQPPYHPDYNTCELCFRQLKASLRRQGLFAEQYTEIAIYHGLMGITASMSQNFFRYCGYI